MDTKEFEIKYIGREPFDIAIQMAFSSEYDLKNPITINGYKIVDNIMYLSTHSKNEDIIKFPYPFNMKQVSDFIYGWLDATEPKEEEPDTDGSIKKGWTVGNHYVPEFNTTSYYENPINKEFIDDWGLLFCVKPVWIEYGK